MVKDVYKRQDDMKTKEFVELLNKNKGEFGVTWGQNSTGYPYFGENQEYNPNKPNLPENRYEIEFAFADGVTAVSYTHLLHTEILKKQELKDFYEMYPDKFNNKTNGITQRRFLLHGNPLLASWVTEHIGDGWITDLSQLSKLKVYADDKKAQQEFMNIK